MLKKKVSLDNEALSFAKSRGIDQQTQLSAITLRKFMTTVILAEFLCDKKKERGDASLCRTKRNSQVNASAIRYSASTRLLLQCDLIYFSKRYFDFENMHR